MAPKKPTPVEAATLKRLLSEHDAYEAFLKASPSAEALRRERAAEEHRLRAEQTFLTEQQAATTARLAALNAAREDVAEELAGLALKNCRGDLKRADAALAWLKQIKVSAGLKRISVADYTEAQRICFRALFPDLAREPTPTPSLEEMEVKLNAERLELAKRIVNSARKARGEEPVDNIITIPFRKMET